MDKIKTRLVAGSATGLELPETVARSFNDLFANQALTSGALAIQGAGSAGAKTTATITAAIEGRLVQVTAGNLPALTGHNLTANQYSVVLFTVDASGTFAVYFGQPAATLNSVTLPAIPQRNAATGQPQVPIGLLVLANGGSAFTGGTTALDAITTTYINTVGAFAPLSNF